MSISDNLEILTKCSAGIDHYRIEGRFVFVDSVLDGRRDVEDILMQRLLR